MGLYEAVFDVTGPSKYLKGFRYVGFSVFGGGSPYGVDRSVQGNCSSQGCVSASMGNSSIPGPLYGLVFFNGAMTFRQIDEIANNMTCPQYVKPVYEPTAPPPPTVPTGTEVQPISPRPGPGGTQVVPVPRTPPAPTPGPTTLRDPKPSLYQLDAGVTQASSKNKMPAVKEVTPIKTSVTAPKVVDMKALEALEAEVFKSLNCPIPGK
jgi:hypothetical protein